MKDHELIRDKLLRSEFERMDEAASAQADTEQGQQGRLSAMWWSDTTDQWLHDTGLVRFVGKGKMILHQPTDRYILFRLGQDACAICPRTAFLEWMLDDLASQGVHRS